MKSDEVLKIVSSNILFESQGEAYPWEKRSSVLVSLIDDFQTDLLGTQEGREPQIRNLESKLSHLSIIDQHREWITERMYPTIFFNEKKFKLDSSGDIWLSETPHVPGSKSFDSAFPRLCTWARLRTSNQTFFIVNVHLDHVKQETRTAQVNVLAKEVKSLLNDNDHLLIMGDFNDCPQSIVRKDLLKGIHFLNDPWEDFGHTEQSSHHKFEGPLENGKRIDWILIDKKLNAKSIVLDQSQKDGIYPSDHYLVKLEIQS
ncbi:MAG: endonuclease/exonuclease/phosphatase family protein [Bacteriovoracaceae bacterium]